MRFRLLSGRTDKRWRRSNKQTHTHTYTYIHFQQKKKKKKHSSPPLYSLFLLHCPFLVTMSINDQDTNDNDKNDDNSNKNNKNDDKNNDKNNKEDRTTTTTASTMSNHQNKNNRWTLYLIVTSQSDGSRIPVHFSSKKEIMTWTSTQLRQYVSNITLIPLSQLKLIYRGRLIVKNDSNLVVSEFQLEHDSVLHCMGQPTTTTTTTSSSSSSSSNSKSTVPTTAATTSTTTTSASTATVVGVPSSSSSSSSSISQPGTTTTVPSSSTQSPLELALYQMRHELHVSQATAASLSSSSTLTATTMYGTALQTLLKIISNIIQHPHEEIYRQVKKTNAAFAKRLGNLPNSHSVMQAAGFVLQNNEKKNNQDNNIVPVYILAPNPQAWPYLLQTQATLQRLVQEHNHQSTMTTMTTPPPSTTTTTTTTTGTGWNPNNPNNDNPNIFSSSSLSAATAAMNNPTAMATNLMSDPNALQAMLQVRVCVCLCICMYLCMCDDDDDGDNWLVG